MVIISENIRIREMSIKDYDNIVPLWKNTPGVGLTDGDSREAIDFFLSRNPDLSLVCEIETHIIATILCGHDGRRGYIYHLTVAEEYRCNGLAKEMVTHCLERLRQQKIPKCYLMVFRENELGNSFWAKNGWTQRDDFNVFQLTL